MAKRFKIDFFELSFLAEACIPPKPIARTSFWYDLIDIHYKLMTDDERAHLFEWIVKNPHFDETNEDCRLFRDRFDRACQYVVVTKSEGRTQVHETFLHKGEYHVARNTTIMADCITDKYLKGTF
jgi:hypothetical protein